MPEVKEILKQEKDETEVVLLLTLFTLHFSLCCFLALFLGPLSLSLSFSPSLSFCLSLCLSLFLIVLFLGPCLLSGAVASDHLRSFSSFFLVLFPSVSTPFLYDYDVVVVFRFVKQTWRFPRLRTLCPTTMKSWLEHLAHGLCPHVKSKRQRVSFDRMNARERIVWVVVHVM